MILWVPKAQDATQELANVSAILGLGDENVTSVPMVCLAILTVNVSLKRLNLNLILVFSHKFFFTYYFHIVQKSYLFLI